MQADVKSIIREGAELTDKALEELIPSVATVPASIHGAMRHSVFAGGKRLRPVLAHQAAIAVAGQLPANIAPLGAAIEMLHTYSLIHDDLPALDNDDLRRGKPTCHVAFGEAIAILAGGDITASGNAYITTASSTSTNPGGNVTLIAGAGLTFNNGAVSSGSTLPGTDIGNGGTNPQATVTVSFTNLGSGGNIDLARFASLI